MLARRAVLQNVSESIREVLRVQFRRSVELEVSGMKRVQVLFDHSNAIVVLVHRLKQ